MLLTAGFAARGATDYHAAVLACLPSGAVHLLPLLGVHPQFQGQHYGEQLLEAVHEWCAEDETSQGSVIDTGNPRYLNFYQRQGYEEIGRGSRAGRRTRLLPSGAPADGSGTLGVGEFYPAGSV